MDLNVELFVLSKHSNYNVKKSGTQDIMFLIKAYYSRFCPNQFFLQNYTAFEIYLYIKINYQSI